MYIIFWLAVPCPNGWIKRGQYCYKAVEVIKTWAESSQHCKSIGGELVSIHDQKENDFIKSKLTLSLKYLNRFLKPKINIFPPRLETFFILFYTFTMSF